MALEMRRPEHVTTRFVGIDDPADDSAGDEARPGALSATVGTALRGLLLGAAIGVVVVAGPAGLASEVALGVIAVAAAFLSWDP
jgi:predicted lipid-binding transport protein (Tim44 family)